ncbi:hypothetical protein GWK47_054095 [Chionoecetes opilio]|uniref:Uncharacterized protein n=1 Tax=Chionoecetes opilio TaxID=41210 RepID=A0A8J4Y044_CHIOP|nr:hypothetical protein GWK47_054095 [Chionoecetes opilio]
MASAAVGRERITGSTYCPEGLSGVDGILGMDVLKTTQSKNFGSRSTAEPGGNRDTAPRILYLPQNIETSAQQPAANTPASRRSKQHHCLLAYHEASPRAKGSTHCIGWRLISLRHCQSHCGVSTIAERVEIGSVDPGELTDTPTNFSAQRSFRYSYRSDAISNL